MQCRPDGQIGDQARFDVEQFVPACFDIPLRQVFAGEFEEEYVLPLFGAGNRLVKLLQRGFLESRGYQREPFRAPGLDNTGGQQAIQQIGV